jgi:mercuric ion transport protein
MRLQCVDMGGANQSPCVCESSPHGRFAKWAAAGGIVSALGICAACCLLPFALISVGVAGAWVGSLDALSPYKWWFIAATVALLGYGFHSAYGSKKTTCAAGAGCSNAASNAKLKITLWIGVALALSGYAFEFVEPML